MSRPADGEIARILAGPGPLGVLGPVAAWPAELRATVDLVLGSAHPMAVCWGPEFALLYNDAAIPGAGRRHPEGLGRPISQVWPEVWGHVGPLLSRVLRSGAAVSRTDERLLLRRHGFIEETYWNLSFSPVRDGNGEVGGVLVISAETTGRVVGERRLRLLARLAEVGRNVRSVDEVLQRVAAVLQTATADVPFAALHRFRSDQEPPRLVVTTGLGDPVPELPVPGVPGFAMVELPGGVRDARGVRSSVAATAQVADADGRPMVGVLLGVPPTLPFDADQSAFLRLAVDHISSAVGAAQAADAQGRRSAAITELDRARSEFFTGVSEEFRTPLTLIQGPLQQLRGGVPGPLLPDVEVLERNAARMLKLVGDLLDVSRMQAGRVGAAFVPVDLGPVTAELAGLFRSTAERAGLILDVDCPSLPRPVWVDRELWEKVVLNLLSNAVKHTFDGGIRVEVSVDDEHAELRVIDTGVGIPEADLPRLFDRFSRVPGTPTRSREGSGIGLAVVRQAVELHGGTVEVTSTVDIGSVFIVRVPLGVAHLPAEALVTDPASASDWDGAGTAEPFLAEVRRWLEPVEPAPSPQPPRGAPAGRVLIADADADVRAYMGRLLADQYEIQSISDGAQALAAATAEPPDLVLAGAELAGPDGSALVRALRAGQDTAGVPVVLVSSSADEETALAALAAGADDFLVMPFSSRELVARVGSHLELGRSRRGAERRFRSMADATPALIWVDDAAGERRFVNQGWLDFTGTGDPAGELGHAWQDRIHPDDRQRYRSVRETAASVAAPFEVEYRLRHASGHHRWVLDRGAPVSAEEPAGFVGGCLDVDAQHRERRRNQLFADVSAALDAEQTAQGRFRALARTLVEHGVADRVRVHEHRPDREPVVRAVAAAEPSAERELRAHPVDVERHRLVVDSGRARLIVSAEEDHPLGLRSAVLAPLVVGGRTIGLIGAGRTAAEPVYDVEDLDLLVEIGRRAGVALDNARLLEQERAASQRLALLHRATALMSAAATSQEVAAVAADHLAMLLGCPVVGVWSATADGPLRLIATHGWTERMPRSWEQLSRRSAIPAVRVFRDRTPMWLPDERTWQDTDPRTYAVVAGAGMTALGLIPLLVRSRCLGVIGVGFAGEHEFGADEREAAVAAAELTAQALERSDLFLAETTARRAAERFGAVATALSRAVDLPSVARVTVAHARAAARAESAAVLVLGEGGQLLLMAAEGELPVEAELVLHEAVRTAEPVWSDPVHAAVPLLVGGKAIGVLGFRFADPPVDEHRRTLVLTLAGQCAQAIARARLHQAEHEMAVTLQRSLLPQQLPELDRLALAPRYVPGTAGTEAGGDWYDVLELDGAGSRVALVVGDVVGRGPAAAAVMGQLRSALAANLVNGQSPAGALEQLDSFARRVRGARASTVACAVVDLDSGELRYACAGHPPPMVADGHGAVRRLSEGRGTPLGVAGRPPYVEAVDRIEPGTSILLCSDGLFERRDEVVDDGLDRLAEVLGSLAGRPEQVADALLDRMLAGRSAPDDVAFVLARLLPGTLRMWLPAEPEQLGVLRRSVGAWCDATGIDEDGLTDLQLALGEAVTNAVEHAYLGRDPAFVRVEVGPGPGGTVDVRVTDSGRWRPPPPDPGYRGRGLSLIRDLATEVHVDAGDDGTTVHFRMPPEPAIPARPAAPAAPPPPAPPQAATRVRRQAGQLFLDGDLDLAGVADVRDQLVAELGRTGTLTLVLAPDSWVSSAGVALLTELAQRATGPLRVVTADGSPARRMLHLAALDQVLGFSAE